MSDVDDLKNINEGNFEYLFKKYCCALCCYAAKIIADEEDAKDIVSNFFCKFWENRENTQITVSFKSYLYGGVHKNCLKYLEHKKVTRKYEEHVQNSDWLSTHDTVYSLIHKELTKGHSWFQIRDQAPCTDCVYQWLCPAPSNYETVIGKPNLCHVKQLE